MHEVVNNTIYGVTKKCDANDFDLFVVTLLKLDFASNRYTQ